MPSLARKITSTSHKLMHKSSKVDINKAKKHRKEKIEKHEQSMSFTLKDTSSMPSSGQPVNENKTGIFEDA